MDDDHSDEEAALYLPEEVPSDYSDDDEPSESVGEAETVVRRGRARVRACLPGCDCERPRGRKCECEKRDNGLCGPDCKCDRSKCRSTVKDSSDEDDE